MSLNALKTLAPTLIASALIAATGLAAAATPAATTAAKQATASPAKKALIAKLVALQQAGGDHAAMLVFEEPVAQLQQAAQQALQHIPEDKRASTVAAINASFKKFGEEATPAIKAESAKAFPEVLGKALDEHFSEEELRQLLSWMESPMYKFQEMNGAISQAYQQQLRADLAPTLAPKFEDLRQAVGKDLGLSPTPPASGTAPAAQK